MRRLIAFLIGLGLCAAAYPQQQIINTGAAPNSGTGDTLQVWATKDNANFTQLFGVFGGGTVIPGTIPTCSGALGYNATTGQWSCAPVPSLSANNTWTGTNTFSAPVTLSSTLAVSGQSTLGAVTAGSMAVTGNATVGGTLGVTGVSTLAGVTTTGLSDTGNATVVGTLGVTGTTTLGAASASSLSVSGSLTGTLTGHATLDLPLSGGTMTGNLSMGANTLFLNTIASANGSNPVAMPNVTMSGTLGVTGLATFNGAVVAEGTIPLAPTVQEAALGAIPGWGDGVLFSSGSSTADSNLWALAPGGGANASFSLYAATDAGGNSGGSVLSANRSGATVTEIDFGNTTSNPNILVHGSFFVDRQVQAKFGAPLTTQTTAPTITQNLGGTVQVIAGAVTVTVPTLVAGSSILFCETTGSAAVTFTGSGVTLHLATGTTAVTGNRTLTGTACANLLWVDATDVLVYGQGVT